MIGWGREENPNEKWRKFSWYTNTSHNRILKRKKCQRCVKWDSMRRKKKMSLPILFTFHFKTVLFHIHTLPFWFPSLVITFFLTGRRHCGNRMVAVPIGPFSFVPSQQLSNNQSVSAVKRNTKKKTNSSAVTVSLMAYSRVVTTISAKCCLFLLFLFFFNLSFLSIFVFKFSLTIIQTAKTAERKTWKELKWSHS